ncbi:hypothetical protein BJF79_29605 [Actinomadura sp. CNU-125]|uniref:GAP family protein n=1 Tax=Actinomadura sp. CNU-125 TaxID=1904961 RepID=UPI000960B411|nr:GAP family protein [Actinomadura sp. CNU-125]OLT37352.1 hypothetical protein BJF79_29605 [Actinomadura sp. CNU-125]
MGEVIGRVLPLAVVVAIGPVAVVAVLLMLRGPRARASGPAFLGGWVAGIVVATTVLVLIANGIGMNGAAGEPKTPVSLIVLLLGVLALVLAVRQWTGRGGSLPGWMQTVDRLEPRRAAMLGARLSMGPEALLMCVAAAITVSEGELGVGLQVVAVAVFVVVAVCTVAVPVAVYFANTGTAVLDGPRAWLERNHAAVTSVLLLVIGVVLLGRGMGGLID